MHNLREGIQQADKEKDKTGRKQILVADGNGWAPVTKRLLKQATQSGKSKNNAASTKYRVKHGKTNGKGIVVNKRKINPVHAESIEKRAPYVTR